jgi:hypothetical protein
MRLSKTSWIAISGMIWFVVGVGLLTLGLNFILYKAQVESHETTSLIAKISPMAGGREQAALVLIVVGLIIGFIKGRFVLVKTVKRVVERILLLEEPLKFLKIYSGRYLMLICAMILLGMSMKWLRFPSEIRGLVDVAIGSALMNGASAYFRVALHLNKELKKPAGRP